MEINGYNNALVQPRRPIILRYLKKLRQYTGQIVCGAVRVKHVSVWICTQRNIITGKNEMGQLRTDDPGESSKES
jgi:hypothetical protein